MGGSDSAVLASDGPMAGVQPCAGSSLVEQVGNAIEYF
jgi:hypothetical protein